MNPAAPRDPDLTRVLLYSAGALFVLNLCAFATGVLGRSTVDERVIEISSTPPSGCGEVQMAFHDYVSDALLRQSRVPAIRTRVEILRVPTGNVATVTSQSTQVDTEATF